EAVKKQAPPLLEYSQGMPAPWDPLTRRLVAGTLSIIFSLAAMALAIWGGILRHSGGQQDRVLGNIAIGTSIAPGLVGLVVMLLVRRRAREFRGLAIFGALLNITYWAAGVYVLLT